MTYPPFHPARRGPEPLGFDRNAFRREFGGESQTVEFKTGTSAKELRRTAIAFANADGGVILVGVDDAGAICGGGRRLDVGTEDAIHAALREVRDGGRYALHETVVDGRPVVVVGVARRVEGFAQDPSGVVLRRRGSRDDPLMGDELVRFVGARRVGRFEASAVAVAIDDVPEENVARLAIGLRLSVGELRASLSDQGLASGDGLTVAGALLLVEDLTALLGRVGTEVVRYQDDATAQFDRRETFRGPVDLQVRQAAEYVQDYLGTEPVVLGLQRHDLPRVPESALREVLVNGVCHRSYELDRLPVRVELRPSSVTVRSPGGLPEPVTEQTMRRLSAPRNPRLIAVMRRLGLADDAGSGVASVEDTMSAELLEPPTFRDHGDEVEVVLPMRSPVAPRERAWVKELERRGDIEPRARLVLVRAARGERLTNRFVRDALRTDDRDAVGALLGRLVDAGLLERHGERGGVTYTIARDVAPPAGLRLSSAELEDVVAGLAEDGPIRNADVRTATGLDRGEALALLDRLVRSGRLTREGERRGTTYAKPPTG